MVRKPARPRGDFEQPFVNPTTSDGAVTDERPGGPRETAHVTSSTERETRARADRDRLVDETENRE